MEDLIAGRYTKEYLLKNGLNDEEINNCLNTPHGSPFQIETWFTILNGFANKIIRSQGYYYALRRHHSSVLVAAIMETMNSANVAQGVVPESEPERSERLQSISPYILTMAGLIREDSYSGSKLWNVDTVDLANRAIKRSKNNVVPLKTVEGKKYADDKIEMFVEYVSNDLKNVDVFVEEVSKAVETYGEIAVQLNAGGVSSGNRAIKLFMNTFRKPSDELVCLRLENLLLKHELKKLEEQESKKFIKTSNPKRILELTKALEENTIKLEAGELVG